MQKRSAVADYVTVPTAVKVTGKSYWTLDRLIRLGRIPAIKIGQVRLVRLSDVEIAAR